MDCELTLVCNPGFGRSILATNLTKYIMINKILKELVDLIYGTKRVVKRYQLNHPAETVFAADASKGIITSANKQVERGLDWITSQRAVVLLTNQKLVCGQWTIPLNEIISAKLIMVKSLFGGGQVLSVQTVGRSLQFGMQINPEWANQKVLPLTIENGKVKNSSFSIVLRLFLIGYLIYVIYERYFST